MSFRPKPWYFERDCPFCTRSASSFCRNPLNFLAHAMWVKWLYQANFQPFQRSFVVLVSFHGHLAQKYEWMPEKDQMKSEKVENWWSGFEWCILNTQKVWSSKKWNSFVTDEFSFETLILRKRLSILHTKCIQFFS